MVSVVDGPENLGENKNNKKNGHNMKYVRNFLHYDKAYTHILW